MQNPTIERVIVLPVQDNEGKSLSREIRTIKLALLNGVGGLSEVRQTGFWVDGGKVYRDVSLRVSVAVTPEQDAWIVSMLPIWCERLRQICLFTQRQAVEIAFVSAPERVEVSA